MRAPAKILLVGTILAIPMLPPLCAVATSQSTVQNTQVQAGDTTASQTLNVVDVTDSTTGVTTATGNSISAAVQTGSLDVQSTQSVNGNIAASTTLNVVTNAGAQTSLTTAATGNASDSGSYAGGALTGTISQTTAAASNITADSSIAASAARTGAASVDTQAIGNSHGIAVQDTSATMTVTQSSAALTQATGGAELMYTPGTASFSTAAVTNNVTAVGTGNASQTLAIHQTMTGARTQAAEFDDAGNAQTIAGQATATVNNIAVTNENGPLNVTDTQSNTSYTRAQAVVTSYEFGAGTASAYGVGNSVLVGNSGQSMSLDNTQSNTGGGIEAIASFTGNNGFDAASSATAMGNAVTAYACSNCGGVMTVRNTQTSGADVSASSSTTVTAGNRSVTGSATAVGNNATFYVSKPGG
jgi:hypothetical protein